MKPSAQVLRSQSNLPIHASRFKFLFVCLLLHRLLLPWLIWSYLFREHRRISMDWRKSELERLWLVASEQAIHRQLKSKPVSIPDDSIHLEQPCFKHGQSPSQSVWSLFTLKLTRFLEHTWQDTIPPRLLPVIQSRFGVCCKSFKTNASWTVVSKIDSKSPTKYAFYMAAVITLPKG